MACTLLWSSAVRVHDLQAYRKMDVWGTFPGKALGIVVRMFVFVYSVFCLFSPSLFLFVRLLVHLFVQSVSQSISKPAIRLLVHSFVQSVSPSISKPATQQTSQSSSPSSTSSFCSFALHTGNKV